MHFNEESAIFINNIAIYGPILRFFGNKKTQDNINFQKLINTKLSKNNTAILSVNNSPIEIAVYYPGERAMK